MEVLVALACWWVDARMEAAQNVSEPPDARRGAPHPPLPQPQSQGSVQPALSAVLKQGSFLLCGSQKDPGVDAT